MCALRLQTCQDLLFLRIQLLLALRLILLPHPPKHGLLRLLSTISKIRIPFLLVQLVNLRIQLLNLFFELIQLRLILRLYFLALHIQRLFLLRLNARLVLLETYLQLLSLCPQTYLVGRLELLS